MRASGHCPRVIDTTATYRLPILKYSQPSVTDANICNPPLLIAVVVLLLFVSTVSRLSTVYFLLRTGVWQGCSLVIQHNIDVSNLWLRTQIGCCVAISILILLCEFATFPTLLLLCWLLGLWGPFGPAPTLCPLLVVSILMHVTLTRAWSAVELYEGLLF